VATYATLAELKARITPNSSNTNNDDALTNALETASRGIDAYCRRVFTADETASPRVFTASNLSSLIVDDFYDDEVTVETDESGDYNYSNLWLATDYSLKPRNGTRHGEPWPYWQIQVRSYGHFLFPWHDDAVRVTAKWGFGYVPAAVKEACLVMAEETFKLKDAPFGVAGFGEFGMLRVRDNPRVASMLNPYRKRSVLVA
jgi:hypothetical protein